MTGGKKEGRDGPVNMTSSMRGYLYKKGDRKWQRRYFELRPASGLPAELCYKETVEVRDEHKCNE